MLHVLMANGIHDVDEKFVLVDGVEKPLLFLRGYSETSPTNEGNNSAIYEGTFLLLTLCIKYNICWCLLTDMLVQPH